MNRYALDTNIVTYYLKGNETIINRITAYCLYHKLILVTNNEQHFKYIANLKTVNWL
ncbi:MAG: hypothetical protein LBU88_06890 [Treponema sp.]|jgi:predicted nucleic acid-binding protein|nr:hypothetical protein [Treponema sp.]